MIASNPVVMRILLASGIHLLSGEGTVKEKYLERYSKKRHGLKHTEEIKENRKKFSDD